MHPDVRIWLKDIELSINEIHDFLSATAPDIWEVAVSSLSNPVQGVSTVIKKVAERAKSEQTKK